MIPWGYFQSGFRNLNGELGGEKKAEGNIQVHAWIFFTWRCVLSYLILPILPPQPLGLQGQRWYRDSELSQD